jgi:hypothetical protein
VAAIAALLSLTLWASPALAERVLTEFWPELDVFVKLDDHSRLFLLGALTRAAETGTSTESTLGAHYDWFPSGLPAPLLAVAPGMKGQWSIWTRVGYQHIAAWNTTRPAENRVLFEATLRSEPMWQALRIANRARVDLRSVDGTGSWRFRNRTRIERTWSLRDEGAASASMLSMLPPGTLSAVTPYAMLEFFWDRREAAWSRRFLQIGAEFEMAGNRSLDLYFARQDDLRQTGSTLWISGVALTLRY